MRVEFKPLYDVILKEAKEDGCIWIPYEVTEEQNKRMAEESKNDASSKPGTV